MFKWILTAAVVFFAGPALAQNTTCATRPPGDNSNACASTAFVQGAVSSPTIPIALPNGSTATTQSPGDNTTKVSTDAFVQNAVTQPNAGAIPNIVTAVAAAAGATLNVPPGTYSLSATLSIPANTTINCLPGAVFQRATGFTNTGAIPLVGISGANISVIDCIEDLNNASQGNLIVGIAPTASTSNVVLRGNTVKNGAFTGIDYISDSGAWTHTNITIDSNTITNVGWSGIYAQGITNVKITNNTISETGYHAIDPVTSTGVIAAGNFVDNSSSPAVVYNGSGSFGGVQTAACVAYEFDDFNISIANNHCNYSPNFDTIGLGEDGITCPGGVVITGNVISNGFGAGIDASCNSIISSNTITNAGATGILVALDYGGPFASAQIIGNKIIDTGTSNSSEGPGIRFGQPIVFNATLTTTSGSPDATIVASGANPAPLFTTNQIVTCTCISGGSAQITSVSGSSIVMSENGNTSGSTSATVQGVTTYSDILVQGNSVEDYRPTQFTNLGIKIEGVNQTYTRVRLYDNLLADITGGTITTPFPSGDIEASTNLAYSPSLTWTGGTPTGATISNETYSSRENMGTVSFEVGAGSALNSATAFTVGLPVNWTKADDASIACLDRTVNSGAPGVGSSGATAITSTQSLTANHFYVCNGSFRIE